MAVGMVKLMVLMVVVAVVLVVMEDIQAALVHRVKVTLVETPLVHLLAPVAVVVSPVLAAMVATLQ